MTFSHSRPTSRLFVPCIVVARCPLGCPFLMLLPLIQVSASQSLMDIHSLLLPGGMGLGLWTNGHLAAFGNKEERPWSWKELGRRASQATGIRLTWLWHASALMWHSKAEALTFAGNPYVLGAGCGKCIGKICPSPAGWARCLVGEFPGVAGSMCVPCLPATRSEISLSSHCSLYLGFSQARVDTSAFSSLGLCPTGKQRTFD